MVKHTLTEEFEGTKAVIRIRKSKDRQQNGQRDKQRSTNHTYKTKDRVTQTPLKTGKRGEVKSSAPERLAVPSTIQYNKLYLKNQTIITTSCSELLNPTSCSTSDTSRVTVKRHEHHLKWK